MQWIGQAWSLLWRSTPPALWNSLLEKMHHYSWLPHNFPFPHMPSLKAETHNQTGIKTTIPPEFAYYVPNALLSEWEYYLRGKLLKHCRPDSSCADLKETMSHQDTVPVQHISCWAFQPAFLGPRSWSHLRKVHRTISYSVHSPAWQTHLLQCRVLLQSV